MVYSRNQQSRKPVPVHQWRITFSGDGKGLHLYEFLSQVGMHQKAERLGDEDMVYSIYHLFSGRARLWYQSVHDQLNFLQAIVRALKQEFLPSNYDLILYGEISNRMQATNETFGEYITHMQSLFKCLARPLAEEHKLMIVQKKNVLPRYAISIAPLGLETLQLLTDACRRIDNAQHTSSRVTYSMPFQQPLQQQRAERLLSNNPHRIHEIVYTAICKMR